MLTGVRPWVRRRERERLRRKREAERARKDAAEKAAKKEQRRLQRERERTERGIPVPVRPLPHFPFPHLPRPTGRPHRAPLELSDTEDINELSCFVFVLVRAARKRYQIPQVALADLPTCC